MAAEAIFEFQTLFNKCRGSDMGCAEVNTDMESRWQFAGNGVHIRRNLPHQTLS